MNQTFLIAGALSNDLFRLANMAHKKSEKGAVVFLREAKKRSGELEVMKKPEYIANIVRNIKSRSSNDVSPKSAETYLMYAILLQNYSLQGIKNMNSQQ